MCEWNYGDWTDGMSDRTGEERIEVNECILSHELGQLRHNFRFRRFAWQIELAGPGRMCQLIHGHYWCPSPIRKVILIVDFNGLLPDIGPTLALEWLSRDFMGEYLRGDGIHSSPPLLEECANLDFLAGLAFHKDTADLLEPVVESCISYFQR